MDRKYTIMDLHSHTYYSNCGRDNPRDLIETAIKHGVEVLGISDHNYGIGERKGDYLQEIRALADEYKGKIKILCGIEIATYPHLYDLKSPKEIDQYDYCLIEHITEEDSIVGGDLFEFCAQFSVPCGIAHTDLFLYCNQHGYEYEAFFKKMAQAGIFWEMNVNFDSIHRYNQHQYVKDFISDEEKISLLRNAGVCISVGFDSHRHEEYDGFRVKKMTYLLKEKGLKTIEEDLALSKKINC